MGNVVSLSEHVMERNYQTYFAKVGTMVLTYNVHNIKLKKRNIEKEMIEGYMRLLTEQVNRK